MQYGLYLSNYGLFGSVSNLVEIAKTAEQAGWDGLFLWDHINPSKQGVEVVDPWVALTAIVSATSKLKVGTTVTPVPRRRPRKLARETVSLDHFSKGRLILGTGIGAPNKEEFEIFEELEDCSIRGEMLDEGLEVLNGLWSGNPFQYRGQYYSIKEPVRFLPASYQQPRIPIWTGGFWNYKNYKPFRRAAKWDGCFPLISSMKGKSRFEVYTDIIEYIQKYIPDEKDGADFDLVMLYNMKGKEVDELKEKIESNPIITWWLDTTYNLYDTGLEKTLKMIEAGPNAKS